MNKIPLLLSAAAMLLAAPSLAAQQPPGSDTTPHPNNAPDLAVSLAAARPPAVGMAIAVAADQTPLPEDVKPPAAAPPWAWLRILTAGCCGRSER